MSGCLRGRIGRRGGRGPSGGWASYVEGRQGAWAGGMRLAAFEKVGRWA